MPEPLELLLPHGPPMRWLRSLDQCTDSGAIATANFRAEDFCVADGRVIETALVECVAQTVAAATGHRSRAGAGNPAPDSGVLAAVSGFRILKLPPLGEDVRIEVKELTRLDRMVLVEGTITCHGEVIATGKLNLYA